MTSGGLRPLVKRVAEASLARSGMPRLSRAYRRGDVLVLAYHNIVPAGETAVGDLSLHLPQAEFARQLDALSRTHEVVPLDTIFEPAGSSRPRVAITFDDAYRGAVEAGVAELASRAMPATLFVAPAFVGGGCFWWDELADAAPGGVPADFRRHCIHRLRGHHARVRDWARDNRLERRMVPPHQTVASEEELARAASYPWITLASHSWSHPNLRALDPSELEEELVRPLAWLRERFRQVIPWLSFPYGLGSPAVEAAAERTGHRGALRVEGGWLPRLESPRRPFAVPRLNIPAGLSLHGFELCTAGLLPRSRRPLWAAASGGQP